MQEVLTVEQAVKQTSKRSREVVYKKPSRSNRNASKPLTLRDLVIQNPSYLKYISTLPCTS
jgi:hypothetical protein